MVLSIFLLLLPTLAFAATTANSTTSTPPTAPTAVTIPECHSPPPAPQGAGIYTPTHYAIQIQYSINSCTNDATTDVQTTLRGGNITLSPTSLLAASAGPRCPDLLLSANITTSSVSGGYEYTGPLLNDSRVSIHGLRGAQIGCGKPTTNQRWDEYYLTLVFQPSLATVVGRIGPENTEMEAMGRMVGILRGETIGWETAVEGGFLISAREARMDDVSGKMAKGAAGPTWEVQDTKVVSGGVRGRGRLEVGVLVGAGIVAAAVVVL